MHRMVESTVEGVVVPSSACVRGASYSAHRAHVVRGIGKRRKAPDCRFRKISGPRTFGAGRARLVCQPRCPTLYLAHNPHTPMQVPTALGASECRHRADPHSLWPEKRAGSALQQRSAHCEARLPTCPSTILLPSLVWQRW